MENHLQIQVMMKIGLNQLTRVPQTEERNMPKEKNLLDHRRQILESLGTAKIPKMLLARVQRLIQQGNQIHIVHRFLRLVMKLAPVKHIKHWALVLWSMK